MTISLFLYLVAAILLILAIIGVGDRLKLVVATLACAAAGFLLGRFL